MAKIWSGILNALVFILFALAVYGGWTLYKWAFDDKVVEKSHSVLQRIEKTSQLVTGYAYVSVLRFRGEKREPVVEDWFFVRAHGNAPDAKKLKAGEVKGLCHRLYKVAFGYGDMQSASKAFIQGNVPADLQPQMLAVEAVEASTTGNFSSVECDRFDMATKAEAEAPRDSRREAILRRMSLDGLVRPQYQQACQILAGLYAPAAPRPASAASSPTPLDGRITACMEAADKHAGQVDKTTAEHIDQTLNGHRPAAKDAKELETLASLFVPMAKVYTDAPSSLGEFSGAIGAMTITVSTVGSISYKDGWWITNWFEEEEFYVRRDITRAMYGSEIRETKMRTVGTTNTLIARMGEPTLLTRDRRIDFSLASKSFDESKLRKSPQKGSSRAERNIVSSVDWALRDVDEAARRLARVYVRASLEAHAEQEKATLQLSFQ